MKIKILQDKRETICGVDSNGLLAELRDLHLKAETLMEYCRGPVRPFVFMSMVAAVILLRQAVDAEAAQVMDNKQEQTEPLHAATGSPAPPSKCPRCEAKGEIWIARHPLLTRETLLKVPCPDCQGRDLVRGNDRGQEREH